MKLFLLRPVTEWKPWYDKCFGFVVAAPDEETARRYASGAAGDEGPNAWIESTRSTCVEIAKRTTCPEGIVLQDFHAA